MFYKIIIGLAIVSLISVSSVIAGTEDDTDGKSRYRVELEKNPKSKIVRVKDNRKEEETRETSQKED